MYVVYWWLSIAYSGVLLKQEITRTYYLTIFNTVQSSLNGMSCRAAVEGFFQSLMALLKRYNALLVADEIQCDMHADCTGRWWACEYKGSAWCLGYGQGRLCTNFSSIIGWVDIIDALKPAQHVLHGVHPGCQFGYHQDWTMATNWTWSTAWKESVSNSIQVL